MSMQVGLENSGSDAHSDNSRSGLCTVKVDRALSGGTCAWTTLASRKMPAKASWVTRIGGIFLSSGWEGDGESIAAGGGRLQARSLQTFRSFSRSLVRAGASRLA